VHTPGIRSAALVSALIFGFYPYRFEHYSHLELQMAYWLPMGLLAIHKMVESGRLRYAVAAGICAAAQLYSSMYYGVFFCVYGLVIGAVLWRTHGIALRRLAAPVSLAAALAGLLAIPLARPYIAAQPRKGIRDIPAVAALSARPTDYLRTHRRSARWGVRLLPNRQPERQLFPGATPIVYSAAALLPPIGPTRFAYVIGLLLAFDGSLGFNGLTYPYLYEWLPPIRGLRVPARFSILVGLSFAVLAGFAASRVLGRTAGWKRHAVYAALVLAAVLDLQPRLELVGVWRQPPAVYALLGSTPDVVLAEFPFPKELERFAENLPYMYFSIWHGLPTVNGYSGFMPPDYPALAKDLAVFPEPGALRLLAARGVTHVTVNCAFYGDRCDSVVQAIRATDALRPVATATWEGQPVHLYQLVKGSLTEGVASR
jgi:hypothetical protein